MERFCLALVGKRRQSLQEFARRTSHFLAVGRPSCSRRSSHSIRHQWSNTASITASTAGRASSVDEESKSRIVRVNDQKYNSRDKQQSKNLSLDTIEWLRETNGSPEDFSKARFLIEQLLVAAKKGASVKGGIEQPARLATLILKRWVHDLAERGEPSKKDMFIVQELFHRTMNLWQRCNETVPPDNAIQLLQTLHDASAFVKVGTHILRPGPRPYSMLFETMQRAAATDPTTAQTADVLMKQLMRYAGFRPYDNSMLVAQNSYLHLLAKCSQSSLDNNAAMKAERFVRNVMVRPDGKSYAAVLQAWSHEPFHAAELLNGMVNAGKINQVCFNICIRAFGNAGYGKEAEELLWKMNDMFAATGNPEAKPDCYSFLGAINGWSKCSNPKRASELLYRMLAMQRDPRYENLRPITSIYNSVLDAWARTPNSGPQVEDLISRMEELHAQGDIEARPSRQSYCIAIRSWGQTIQYEAPDRATDLLRRMKELSEAGRRDLTPNTIAYTSLIQCWAQSSREEGADRALTIFRHMLEQSWQKARPNTLTLNAVLNAFARRGMADEANNLLQEMVSRCITAVKEDDVQASMMRPNTICWVTVITAYRGRADAGARAAELLSQLEHLYDQTCDPALKPSSALYYAVIGSHSPSETEAAEEVLWRMMDRYEATGSDKSSFSLDPPNTKVCNAILRLWSKSDNPVAPQRAEEILRWMEGQAEFENGEDICPDPQSFEFVVQTWSKSKRKNAKDHIDSLLAEMQSKYPPITTDSDGNPRSDTET